jgi:hypothetical protein
MAGWLLRIEGVNFAATMGDTQDLSTQRGASLTLLNGGYAVSKLLAEMFGTHRVEPIYIGASQALFRLGDAVDASQAIDKVRRYLRARQGDALNKPLYPQPQSERAPPVAMMTWVGDVIDASCPHAAFLLEAKLKRAQFQTPTIRPHAQPRQSKSSPCPIEHRLPADGGISVRGQMYPAATVLADYRPARDEKVIAVSRSVAQRRSYGRSARQRFYDHELKATTGLHFADGLPDLVSCPPATLPLPLANKIALIAADGIGFGRLLQQETDAAGDAIEGARRFSAQVEMTNRERILRPVIKAFEVAAMAGGMKELAVSIPYEKADNPRARRERWFPILRFETLTYAGEDIVWLAPAWLAWEVAGFLFAAARTATIAGAVPEYRVGVVVCPENMPIRKGRELAEELAYKVTGDGSKDAGCQIELVESIDVSDGYLDRHRERLAGGVSPSRFSVRATDFEDVTAHVAALKHTDGFPRSQVHRLLRRAVHENATADADGRQRVVQDLERTLQRGQYPYRFKGSDEILEPKHFAFAPLNAQDNPLFGLLRLAQLWDVILPLGAPVLTVP